MNLEKLNEQQLRIKLKETQRKLDIKTLALVNTKKANYNLRKIIKNYDQIVTKHTKNIKEALENAKYN